MLKKKSVFIFTVACLLAACNFTPRTPAPASGFPTENPYIEVPRVSLEDAKAAFDNGTAIFVDVRLSTSYQQEHIPGALSIPFAELKARIQELDPSQWIITYCT
jgi:3-mercaptopyruvate sulfurtransferase SseA